MRVSRGEFIHDGVVIPRLVGRVKVVVDLNEIVPPEVVGSTLPIPGGKVEEDSIALDCMGDGEPLAYCGGINEIDLVVGLEGDVLVSLQRVIWHVGLDFRDIAVRTAHQ